MLEYLKLHNQGSLRDQTKNLHNKIHDVSCLVSIICTSRTISIFTLKNTVNWQAFFGDESVNHQVLNDALDCIRTKDLLKAIQAA